MEKNFRNALLIGLLSSVMGGMISLFGYKALSKDQSSQYNDPAYTKLVNMMADTSQFKVPEGLNFVYAAQIVNPAVVHIINKMDAGSQEEDPMNQFFGMPPGSMGPQMSSGSGVIISTDGYIVTNNHVVDGASKIEVTLNDKRSYVAKVIGTDPSTDLSLIKIEETNLPFVKFGNSDKVLVGEWVLAVGNPFNLTSTVTAGIVSAKARNISILRDRDNLAIESFIQTDAAVNPGNSGGALVNLRGELVGINTAIATPNGTFAGYSFAVPSLLVKKVIDDLLKFGQVQRGLLGVSIKDMNADLAKEKNMSQVKGVLVAGVNSGSAAEAVGMKEGDVILKIEEVEVNSASELQEIVARYRPGDKVAVTLLRDGKTLVLNPTLKNKVGEVALQPKDQSSVKSTLGADLQTVPQAELSKLKLSGGAKVARLFDGSLRNAGVREGFIITSISNHKVNSPEEAISLLEKMKSSKEGVLLEGVYPDGKRQYYGFGW